MENCLWQKVLLLKKVVITPPNSMENLQYLNFIFLLLQFSSLLSLSLANYTLPDHYFINCGSDSNASVSDRTFIGDKKYPSSSISPGRNSKSIETTNASADTSSLYQTARIYEHPSSYKLEISQNGTYLVRLHFQVFPSSKNLSAARFNVLTSKFSLLSNYRVPNNTNSPEIKEFLLTLNVGKFEIYFIPSQETSLAFVNAIEVFLAPENFTENDAPSVTSAGSNGTYRGLLSQGLQTVYRINVGGSTIMAEDDTLRRKWIVDDDFLLNSDAAKNSSFYTGDVKYEDGNSTEYIAPDSVYKTAKELNGNASNITWSFDVMKNTKHLVRLHFCDIISVAEAVIWFNLYIYSKFIRTVQNISESDYKWNASPFYCDFMVDSDNSGFMNISVRSGKDSDVQNAYLNGVEIMELMKESGPIPIISEPKSKTSPSVIVGSTVGGVAVFCIFLAAVVFGLKCRKAKSAETLEWSSGGRSSYGRLTERTVDGSSGPNFNLGLKIPFYEIQYATKNFNGKLVIGEGGFGKVYKGTFRNGMKVAVKRSEPGHGQGFPEFQAEIMVLSKIRHRHLVSLIGYCDERSEMILVYEFMEKGTLRDHLYGDSEGSSSQNSVLSWKQRLEICIGSAEGLHYLHTGSVGGIIHRDVKSTNILLDENYVAKVADFGLSKSGSLDQTQDTTGVKGSFGYLDPEYLRTLQFTDKSDVYSFGVVLLEMLCARPAINNSLSIEQVNLAEWGMSWQKKGELEKIIDPLLVGKINPRSLSKFGETAEKCLKKRGVERPTMGEVLWDLNYVLQLQRTAVHREPHEDSTVDASMELQLPVLQRFPSHNVTVVDEGELILRDDGSDSTASEVFSQLRIYEAR